ncbi:MAG TPA: MFS transporter [Bryobacteraceae bacterium]|jgi:ACS family hexuronate transporter-like MFS transporter|nr:MFS transporter [Bryobacteraceae bacterium]
MSSVSLAHSVSRRLRWWIAGLLFLSTVLNYIDRQNLSILARTIQDDLKISDFQYSYVVQAFFLAYTLTYIVAGRLTDWLGARSSMALFIAWWSIADMLTALSRSAFSLGVFRFLLGMGEPGNYTAAPKAVAEYFAPRDQGFVIGLYTAGATLGATVAPPVVAFTALHFGWRLVFVFTGGVGLLWLVLWLGIYGGSSPRAVLQPASTAAHPWRTVLHRRQTWQLLIARALTDPVWYFYLFWFPKYLTDARHQSLQSIGRTAWVVYLAADIGCLAAGYFSSVLIRKGAIPAEARVRLMAGSAVLLPFSAAVAVAPNLWAAVLIGSLATFGHLAWLTSLSSLILDLYPKELVGTVFGIVAAGSGLGGMLATELIGLAVTHYSYAPVFTAMGVLHPLALLLIWPLRRGST